MTTLVSLPDQQHIVLRGVSWSYYEQTLDEIGKQPVHVAYLDGAMELMSPLPEHERPKKAIANLIVGPSELFVAPPSRPLPPA